MWKDLEPREHAENLVKYFEQILRENDSEVWQKGLSTAQEWLRLIDSDDFSTEELSSFLGVVHANRHESSGWGDLAYGAYSWARLKGHAVPPPEEFFTPPNLSNILNMYETPSSEQALELLNAFQQYNREDPSCEMWEAGIKSTKVWLSLIEAEEVEKSEIVKLIENVFVNQRKYHSVEWFGTALRISYWCKKNWLCGFDS